MTPLQVTVALAAVDIRADARDHVPSPEPSSDEIQITVDLPQP
jgi:hypothetical protein